MIKIGRGGGELPPIMQTLDKSWPPDAWLAEQKCKTCGAHIGFIHRCAIHKNGDVHHEPCWLTGRPLGE